MLELKQMLKGKLITITEYLAEVRKLNAQPGAGTVRKSTEQVMSDGVQMRRSTTSNMASIRAAPPRATTPVTVVAPTRPLSEVFEFGAGEQNEDEDGYNDAYRQSILAADDLLGNLDGLGDLLDTDGLGVDTDEAKEDDEVEDEDSDEDSDSDGESDNEVEVVEVSKKQRTTEGTAVATAAATTTLNDTQQSFVTRFSQAKAVIAKIASRCFSSGAPSSRPSRRRRRARRCRLRARGAASPR